jgi:hypothetical protein
MATPMLIEEESGTCTGRQHPHNGYYAGDFFHRTKALEPSVPLRLVPPALRLLPSSPASADPPRRPHTQATRAA